MRQLNRYRIEVAIRETLVRALIRDFPPLFGFCFHFRNDSHRSSRFPVSIQMQRDSCKYIPGNSSMNTNILLKNLNKRIRFVDTSYFLIINSQKNMKRTDSCFVFSNLPGEFPQRKNTNGLQISFLTRLRDCIFDTNIRQTFREQTSRNRSVDIHVQLYQRTRCIGIKGKIL